MRVTPKPETLDLIKNMIAEGKCDQAHKICEEQGFLNHKWEPGDKALLLKTGHEYYTRDWENEAALIPGKEYTCKDTVSEIYGPTVFIGLKEEKIGMAFIATNFLYIGTD